MGAQTQTRKVPIAFGQIVGEDGAILLITQHHQLQEIVRQLQERARITAPDPARIGRLQQRAGEQRLRQVKDGRRATGEGPSRWAG